MEMVHQLLDIAGVGRERMQLRWVSAAEGQAFANFITELTQVIRELGSFDPEKYKFTLSAVEQVLNSPRVRWLTGMDKHLTEGKNVYNENVDPKLYQELMTLSLKEELEKALILESLKEGPKSVREMASMAGLPVYTVSLRLNDLERRGLAELKGFEGSTPKFISLAA
jgi:predicted Rossmann fold nucleotide-binding protein DprA/Smf involved in DNA uptake